MAATLRVSSAGPATPLWRRDAATLAARLPSLVVAAKQIAQSVMHGVHGRRRAGPGETFWQFRQFNQASDTRWVGAVGTGIEIGFASDWSVAVEYDHLFMGNPNVTFPVSTIAVTRSDNIRQDVDMGTVRLNYRFGQ